MLDRNLSEKEQVDLVKKWWNNYGISIVIAIIIGVGLGYGWRYYKSYHQQRAEQASSLYQQAFNLVAAKTFTAVPNYTAAIIKQYPSSPYAVLSKMLLAKIAVSHNKYALAKQDLQWALKHSKIASLKQIARIRIAAIDLQLAQADDALKVLKTVDDKTFMPMINSLIGDAYHKQGNMKKAQDYYQKAQSGYSSLGINNQIVTMKLAG